MPLSLRLAMREMRGGLAGFRVFLAVLALGVGIIAAVGSLAASLTSGLRDNARALMGGDVEVDMSQRAASAEEIAYLARNADAVSAVREMRSMARTARGDAALVEVKGVDAAYPLVGTVKLEPALSLSEALAPRNGVPGAVAEPELLARLGLALGDAVRLGDLEFALRAVITDEPDRTTSLFSLGPRLMVANELLEMTGLVRLGSLIEHEYRLRLSAEADAEQWAQAAREELADDARVRPFTSAQPAVQRFVDRFGAFLALVGLTVLVIGGVGVANAVQNYIGARTETIATLKCLGADGGLVFRIYFWQTGVLALLGIAAGVAAGALAPLAAPPLIGDDLPVAPVFAIHPVPLALAAVYGGLTAMVFALWPLAQAREIPAAGLFRHLVAPARVLPRPGVLAALALAAAALVLLAIFGGGNAWFAAWFVGGAAAALGVFRLAAWGMVQGLGALPQPGGVTARLAVAGLTRPGAATANVILSLGAGLSVLVAVALLDANIRNQITEQMPERAPAFFFIDIQPDQAEAFDAVLAGVPGVADVERIPTLRGRVTAVNGVPVDEVREQRGGHWFLRGGRVMTYAAALPADAAVVAGEWWDRDYAGPPVLSLDEEVSRETGIGIGDILAFTILGREVAGTVVNLRRVDWEDMGLNFSVIFAPGALESAPQTHVASAVMDRGAEEAVFRAVTETFANVTAIRVRDVIERVTGLIVRIGTAVRAVSVLTIAAGVLVLAGAIAASRRMRLYDSVILKVLGATRGDVLRANLMEFALLGLLTAALAAAAGTAAAWAVVRFVMEAPFALEAAPVLGAAAGGAGLVVVLGLAGTWRVLGQRPAPVLRAV